jgi:hypothetical protein
MCWNRQERHKKIRKGYLYWKLVTKCSGLDSQSMEGGWWGKASIISRHIIFSEFVPIFCKKEAEYCLHSEERNAIRKSPQQMLIFCKMGHTTTTQPHAGIQQGPCLRHCTSDNLCSMEKGLKIASGN